MDKEHNSCLVYIFIFIYIGSRPEQTIVESRYQFHFNTGLHKIMEKFDFAVRHMNIRS